MERMVCVCVCACTYKRPEGLRALLDGLGRQTFAILPRPVLRVVIADNEGSERARQLCADFERQSRIPLTYVHEPQRGISFARNACLDHIPPDCDFFAFIDDDEVPEPDWLERLIEAQAATGADVVQGVVFPVFSERTPRWLTSGGFLGWPRRGCSGKKPMFKEYQELEEAYTNNVLARVASVKTLNLRFDPAFALTGGEDSDFFRRLKAARARIVYAPRAMVKEDVPPERATLWYRLRLEYRIAASPLPAKIKKKNQHKYINGAKHMWRRCGLGDIASGITYFVCCSLSGNINMQRTVVACMRVASGAGRLSRAMGISYRIYL